MHQDVLYLVAPAKIKQLFQIFKKLRVSPETKMKFFCSENEAAK